MQQVNTVTIQSESLVAEVSPLGAELQRLAIAGGGDLQWNGDPAVWSGRAPILFPVVGALNGGEYRLDGRTYAMPKHGFARRSTFDVVATSDASAVFRLDASDATRAIYPFEFRLDVAFTLEGPTLTLAATIANRGEQSMPASFGFHPAFRRPLPFGKLKDAHRIVFDCDEPAPIRRIDPQGLLTPQPHPTPVDGRTLVLRDSLFVDDALIFDRVSSPRVSYGAPEGPQLAVAFQDFPMLGIWTKPGADFICIEPWAGIADPQAFEGDLRSKPGIFEVAPGGARRLSMSITLLPEAQP